MLNKKIISTALVAVAVTAFFTACGNDSKSGNTKPVTVEDIKTNYVSIAHAVYSDSLETAKELQTSVDSFLADPTQANLIAAQVAYKATRKPYQQSEIMRWDGAITANKPEGNLTSVDDWEGQVNAWPLEEDQIESIIAGSDTIDMQLLVDRNGTLPDGTENEANVTTGVHAVEFLLWNKDENARGAGVRDVADFGKDADCTENAAETIQCRRSSYLRVATDLLVKDLTDMQNEWSPEAEKKVGTLAYNYLQSDKALDYMVQAIGSMAVGELGGARLSAGLWRPNVLDSTKFEKGLYEEEHDCFSDLSHVAVYYNYQGILNAWNGTYKKLDGTEINGASLAQHIKAKSFSTYKKLDALLVETQAKMKKIYDAGERVGDTRKSFDQIIEDSFKTYEKEAEKTPELVAVESTLVNLAKIEFLIVELVEVMSLDAVDTDEIGETD